MEPQPQSGVKAWQWVVTAIVIVVLIIIGIMVFKGGSSETPTTSETPVTTNTQTSQDVNRIVMSDQYPGNVVYISSVQFEEPGFLVIHKDKAGQPGDIIGSAYFAAGINPGKITLTSPTTEGGIYYAVLHSDDGDKVFNATKDLPLKDSRGKIVMKLFRAAASVGEAFKG